VRTKAREALKKRARAPLPAAHRCSAPKVHGLLDQVPGTPPPEATRAARDAHGVPSGSRRAQLAGGAQRDATRRERLSRLVTGDQTMN